MGTAEKPEFKYRPDMQRLILRGAFGEPITRSDEEALQAYIERSEQGSQELPISHKSAA
jgi:hypothetical protein